MPRKQSSSHILRTAKQIIRGANSCRNSKEEFFKNHRKERDLIQEIGKGRDENKATSPRVTCVCLLALQLSNCSFGLFETSVKVKVKPLSRVQLFATPWTVGHQARASMGLPRQEYWSGLPFPSPGDLPDPGIEPGSPALQAEALTSEPPGKP